MSLPPLPILGRLLAAGLVAALPAQVNWFDATEPPAPTWAYCAAAFDTGRSQVVRFGGKSWNGGWSTSNETWVLEGSALGGTWETQPCGHWQRVATTGVPAAGDQWAMAYDPPRGNCVMFGGNETWLWNGSDWRRAAPANSPPARRDHGMVFHPQSGKVVLFGGRSGTTFYNDTWEWDGANWLQRAPTRAPPARRAHALAAWRAGPVVLFGGIHDPTPAAIPMNDTWQWDGTNWTQMTPATVPPRRIHARIACSTVFGSQEIMLMAGGAGPAFLQDAWEWNGSNWTTAGTLPMSGRAGHTMVSVGNGIASSAAKTPSPPRPTRTC